MDLVPLIQIDKANTLPPFDAIKNKQILEEILAFYLVSFINTAGLINFKSYIPIGLKLIMIFPQNQFIKFNVD